MKGRFHLIGGYNMNKLTLTYIGLDSRERPVYQDTDGKLFVDTDSRAYRSPRICTKYQNNFDGEPDTPIEYIERYKDLEVKFVPERYADR